MKLQEMSTKDLLGLHNTLADTPAGPKSFATKTKLIARIESIATDKNVDLASFEPPKAAAAVEPHKQPQVKATEAADASPEAEKATTGKRIGQLARELLLDPAGYPHVTIAEMVNARIAGARTTAKSVTWYACRMRKEGAEVPARQKKCSVVLSTHPPRYSLGLLALAQTPVDVSLSSPQDPRSSHNQ
jgi:hypothetical protein